MTDRDETLDAELLIKRFRRAASIVLAGNREIGDRVTRIGEELDSIRERSLVLQEQVVEERSERMNQRLFVLAIISAVFLPLGFVTGLFGVNLGGMPGAASPIAFTALCVGMTVVTLGLLLLFRRMRWL